MKEQSWTNNPHEARAWADAHHLIQNNSPNVLNHILAQHFSRNHGLSEAEALNHAVNVSQQGKHIFHAVLAENIKRGYESGYFKTPEED